MSAVGGDVHAGLLTFFAVPHISTNDDGAVSIGSGATSTC